MEKWIARLWRWGATVIGLVLMVAGIPGIPDGFKAWADWLSFLGSGDNLKWVAMSTGLAIVAFANVPPLTRLLRNLVRPTVIVVNGPKGPTTYLTRSAMDRERRGLMNELQDTEVVWAAWFAGTYAVANEVFQATRKPQRLILLDPHGDHIHTFAEIFSRTPEELSSHIKTTTRRALEAGLETYWFDGPLASMVLYEPESGNGWARIEVSVPLSEIMRPNILFRQADYPQEFEDVKRTYEAMLERSRRVYLAQGGLVT